MEIEALVPLLNVEDAERSIAFYTGYLGFQVAQRYTAEGATAWAMLRHGAVKLMINRANRADSARRRQRAGYSDAVLYLYVASARDCHATLQSAGAATSEVTLEPYGVEEFHLRDPDGYPSLPSSARPCGSPERRWRRRQWPAATLAPALSMKRRPQ
jgi:uncharacterized glyoxalase superfamily protein PhnB